LHLALKLSHFDSVVWLGLTFHPLALGVSDRLAAWLNWDPAVFQDTISRIFDVNA
jgi:hypothetical protein